MTEWQPIDTAPKNERVLVGTTDPNGNGGCRVVMSTLRYHPRKLITGEHWGWDNTGSEWTHWTPLPPAPESV